MSFSVNYLIYIHTILTSVISALYWFSVYNRLLHNIDRINAILYYFHLLYNIGRINAILYYLHLMYNDTINIILYLWIITLS